MKQKLLKTVYNSRGEIAYLVSLTNDAGVSIFEIYLGYHTDLHTAPPSMSYKLRFLAENFLIDNGYK